MVKLLKITLSLILFLMIHGSAMADKDTRAKAALKIENTIFDAGTVVEGCVVFHDFKIKNNGNKALKILDVEPGCGCTGVTFDKIIMPLKTGFLHVKFNTLNEIGDQIKTIKIFSNDPDNEIETVEMAAHVLEAVKIEPNRIFFNGLKGQGGEKKIRISTVGDIDFNLEIEKKKMPEDVDFSFRRSDHGYDLLFSSKALKPGNSRGRIILKTDLEQRPYITIPVFSRVYEKIEIIPSKIEFGKISQKRLQNSTLLRTITLKSNVDKDFRINSIESQGKMFSTKIIRLENIKAYKIEIVPDFSNLSSGKLVSNLKILTNEKDSSIIDIPLSIEIN